MIASNVPLSFTFGSSMDGLERPRRDRWSGSKVAMIFGILFHQIVNRVIELHVFAVQKALWVKIQLHIRVPPVSFDNPSRAFRIPAPELGLRYHAAAPKRFVAPDTDPTAPSARADHRSKLELFETERERLAITAALPVDQRRHVAVEGMGRDGIHVTVARPSNSEDFAIEMGEDHWGHKATMVPTVVHDQAPLAPLRRIIACELAQAASAHIIEVN